MGKTVSSYPMALEFEMNRWKNFRKTLLDEEKQAFDEIMDMARINPWQLETPVNRYCLSRWL